MPTRSSSCRTRRTSRRRLSAVVVAVVALSALGLSGVSSVVNAASASAHAVLVNITPASGSQLTTTPKEVDVELSEPVNPSFVSFVVTTAAGVSVTSGKPTVVGANVTQALIPHLAAGAYRVVFRVVSTDGHPVAGASGFTLLAAPRANPSTSVRSAAPPTTPAAPPTTPAADVTDVVPVSPSAGEDGDLSTSTLAMAGAFGFLAVGAGLLLWLRKRP